MNIWAVTLTYRMQSLTAELSISLLPISAVIPGVRQALRV